MAKTFADQEPSRVHDTLRHSHHIQVRSDNVHLCVRASRTPVIVSNLSGCTYLALDFGIHAATMFALVRQEMNMGWQD